MGQGYRKDRRFPRIPAEHAVMVRLLGGPRFEGFAKTRVIGLGGNFVPHLWSRRRVEIGQRPIGGALGPVRDGVELRPRFVAQQ